MKLLKKQAGGSMQQSTTKVVKPLPKLAPKSSLFDKDKVAYADSVLSANSHLDWVKRLYEPNAPSIQVPGEPYRSTHLMADDGKGYVYPSIIRLQDGSLKHLSEDEAYNYAKQTNTGIQLPSSQGSWFAANGYKVGTNVLNSIGENGVPLHDPNYVLPKQQMGGVISPFNTPFNPDSSNYKTYFRPAPYTPQNPQLGVKDTRKLNATSGKPLNQDKENISGNYNTDRIDNIIHYAKVYGIDPYNLIAMDMQETSLGKSKEDISQFGHRVPPGHLLMGLLNSNIQTPSKAYDAVQDQYNKYNITSDQVEDQSSYDDFARTYVDKMNYAKKLGINTEAGQLQAYNGYGKILPSTEQSYSGYPMKSIYGVPIPANGLDFNKDPIYGKRIIDLRDNVLKQSPDIKNAVDTVYRKGGAVTNTGYLPDSPDRHNDFNIIPSNQITMTGVQKKILGTDDLGNQMLMHPGGNYTFPGNYVHEVPIKKDGGGIHIKKSHEGRFTEYKKRTGKTTEEALHSKDPHVRAMANFSRNAASWKHQDGGDIQHEVNNLNPDGTPMVPHQDWLQKFAGGYNKFSEGFTQGFNKLSGLAADINQGVQDRYSNNYLRDRTTSDSLFAAVPGSTTGMRGDYSVTGSSYGQFRPDQMGAKSPYGMQGKFYQTGGGYIPDDNSQGVPQFQGSSAGPNVLGSTPDQGYIPQAPVIGPQAAPIDLGTKEVNLNDSTKFAYNYYTKEKGLPGHIAAGIVGNLYQESGLKPGAVEQDHTGNGRGIAQWDVRDRWQGYLDWAKSNQRNPYDLKSQLDYVLVEPGQSKQALDKLKNTTTPEQAALIFGKIYERPSEKYAAWNTREKVAGELNSGKFQVGGEYDLSDKEIQNILQNGGELDYIV